MVAAGSWTQTRPSDAPGNVDHSVALGYSIDPRAFATQASDINTGPASLSKTTGPDAALCGYIAPHIIMVSYHSIRKVTETLRPLIGLTIPEG